MSLDLIVPKMAIDRRTGDETVVLLVTYAGTPGIPTSILTKSEEEEY